MTGSELRAARIALGKLWFGRPLLTAELGRALRLQGHDLAGAVTKLETRNHGTASVSGPVSACVQMWLDGALPPDGLDAIRHRDG